MKSKITFRMTSPTRVEVLRDGKVIGQMWSELKDGTLPYPHNKDSLYCQNAIQICGFDGISEIWACGPFPGKKDTVVHFEDTTTDYMKRKLEKYKQYVDEFIRSGEAMDKLKNFKDFTIHEV